MGTSTLVRYRRSLGDEVTVIKKRIRALVKVMLLRIV